MTTDGIILRLAKIFGQKRSAQFFERLASRSRKKAQWAHRQQYNIQWGDPAAAPEWYDHFLDQYFAWPTKRMPYWVERGVYSTLAIAQGARVLELCCGDGFNAAHFYSSLAGSVLAVDFDQTAIDHANKRNAAANVEYRLVDVRDGLPAGKFDNIVWDAAIEHFTPSEISELTASIKLALADNGILSGYTITEGAHGKHLVHHEYEFRDKEDLLRFLSPDFANVRVFETVYPDRHNLYFWASNGPLPFDDNWPASIAWRAQDMGNSGRSAGPSKVSRSDGGRMHLLAIQTPLTLKLFGNIFQIARPIEYFRYRVPSRRIVQWSFELTNIRPRYKSPQAARFVKAASGITIRNKLGRYLQPHWCLNDVLYRYTEVNVEQFACN